MMRALLIRGMLVGVLAGLLAFGVAKVFGEPQVDHAISFEEQMDAAKDAAAEKTAQANGQQMPEMAHEHEIVSRETQASIGLLTGVVVYSAAFGGLFALVFGFVQGRVSSFGPRATAALLAGAAFLTIYFIPSLKYPANPPSVGLSETIGYRTTLFFIMIALSIAAMALSIRIGRKLVAAYGNWNGTLFAGAIFIVLVAIIHFLMPPLNEVPDGFPAVVLWSFRVASIGIQIVLWTTLGIVFGYLAEILLVEHRRKPSWA